MGKIYFIPYEIEKFLHKIDNVLVITKAVKELNLMNVILYNVRKQLWVSP